MTKITENSTAQVRVPVAPKSTLDTAKVRGLIGYDETSKSPSMCPGDGENWVRSMVHPGDLVDAGTLSGSEEIPLVQSGVQKKTTVSQIAANAGFVRTVDLANDSDPAKGAGLVGFDGITVYSALTASEYAGKSILRYFDKSKWEDIINADGLGVLHDGTEELQAAIDDTPRGGVLNLVGRLEVSDTITINKPLRITGALADLGGRGTHIYRARSLNAPAFIIGNEDDEGAFINAPIIERLQFAERQNPGQPLKTAHFMHLNALLKGGFRDVAFNGDMIGGWIYGRRVQDILYDNCFFRGGGSDLGDYAQIVLGDPQESEETGFHPNNEWNFLYCHFEIGPNTGNVYTDPVTGLPSTGTRGSVAIRAAAPLMNSRTNSCRWTGCKFELGAGGSWEGEGVRKAGIYLRNTMSFQFSACEFNQTARFFDSQNDTALEINGKAYVNQFQARRRFGRFVDCDKLKGRVVYSYNGAPAEIIRCPGHDFVVESALGTFGASHFAMERKAELGPKYLAASLETTTGATLVTDQRGSTGEAIRSKEIAVEADYGSTILALRPTNSKERNNGMTIKAKACLESAPTGTHRLAFSWRWTPADTVYFDEPDGVRTEWNVPMYFAPDTDFPGGASIATPIRAYKRHKTTGVETEVTIATKNGENDWNGGSVVLAEAVASTYEVVIRREAYGKGIITTAPLTTDPMWYSAYIPPNVLRLENVAIRIQVEGDWGAGLRYRLLDWDYSEEAWSNVLPYYPTTAVASCSGLPPNGNVWTTDSIIRVGAPSVHGGLYFRCIAPSGSSGAGTSALLTPSFNTHTHNGGSGTFVLPEFSTFGSLAGNRYTIHNAGTGVLSVERGGSDEFASASFTAFDLAPGESAVVESVTVPSVGLRWAIMTGVRSSAEITFSGSVTQSIAAGATPIKLTAFNTNGPASANLTADQANKKLTTTRNGVYEIAAMWSGYVGTSADVFLAIFVGGTLAGVTTMERFGATGATQTESLQASASLYIAAGVDIDLRVYHSDAGANSFVTTRASLSAKRL